MATISMDDINFALSEASKGDDDQRLGAKKARGERTNVQSEQSKPSANTEAARQTSKREASTDVDKSVKKQGDEKVVVADERPIKDSLGMMNDPNTKIEAAKADASKEATTNSAGATKPLFRWDSTASMVTAGVLGGGAGVVALWAANKMRENSAAKELTATTIANAKTGAVGVDASAQKPKEEMAMGAAKDMSGARTAAVAASGGLIGLGVDKFTRDDKHKDKATAESKTDDGWKSKAAIAGTALAGGALALAANKMFGAKDDSAASEKQGFMSKLFGKKDADVGEKGATATKAVEGVSSVKLALAGAVGTMVAIEAAKRMGYGDNNAYLAAAGGIGSAVGIGLMNQYAGANSAQDGAKGDLKSKAGEKNAASDNDSWGFGKTLLAVVAAATAGKMMSSTSSTGAGAGAGAGAGSKYGNEINTAAAAAIGGVAGAYLGKQFGIDSTAGMGVTAGLGAAIGLYVADRYKSHAESSAKHNEKLVMGSQLSGAEKGNGLADKAVLAAKENPYLLGRDGATANKANDAANVKVPTDAVTQNLLKELSAVASAGKSMGSEMSGGRMKM